jgi:hypothetical protein
VYILNKLEKENIPSYNLRPKGEEIVLVRSRGDFL